MMKLTTGSRHLFQGQKPWFYLADTAWELFHRPTLEDAKWFLSVRASQRYTVIQAVLLAEVEGLREANAQGHTPLIDFDPTRPDERYFQDCDQIIDEAGKLGLLMGLLPTWGDKWSRWGAGPRVFTPENAFTYGAFVGRRYKDKAVIWIIGGDRPVQSEDELRINRQMALGIRSESPDQLMTFHPNGGVSSSKFVQTETWLDFNMMQSGHTGRDNPVGDRIAADLALTPHKPTLDGEPNYEAHPVMKMAGGNWVQDEGWFDEFDCRKQAWRALLAGACGHTYGCHSVWQFFDPGRHPAINHAPLHWREAVMLPGARQMQHLRHFFESIEWGNLVGDQTLFADGPGETSALEGRAARARDGSWAIFYVPTQRPIRVRAGVLHAGLAARWFDPRTGEWTAAPGPGPAWESPAGGDWVLMLS